MNEFIESPTFPSCPSFGYVSQPMYSVTVTRLGGGQEFRNRNWSRPLHQYSVTVGPKPSLEVQQLLEFWHAVGGMECGFRFKDWADYKSVFVTETPTALDQPLVDLVSSPDSYQLVKDYTAGARTQRREIYKPLASTITVANASGVVQVPSKYTLDDTTGILTPNGTFVGVPTTWGGEFDVPCRFDSEFPVELQNNIIESVQFAIMELRP